MMRTIIDYSFTVAEIIIALIALQKIILMEKDDYDNTKNIKVRLMFFYILMALIVFDLIPKLILGKSIRSNMLIIILLGVGIGKDFYTLNKNKRRKY